MFSSLPVEKGYSIRPASHSSIQQSVSAGQKIPTASPRWNRLTDSICYFVAKDMQPFETVDDLGFRKLIHTFEPTYDPPSRKSLTTKYLPEMFTSLSSTIQNKVCSLPSFALTTDFKG